MNEHDRRVCLRPPPRDLPKTDPEEIAAVAEVIARCVEDSVNQENAGKGGGAVNKT